MNRVDVLRTAPIQFRPDAHHASVADVLHDSKLSRDEKRAILSAWASDMYAVESAPGLRAIPGHPAPLRLDAILNALRALDDDDPPPRGGMALRMPSPRPRINVVARRDDDARDDVDLRTASIETHRKNIRRYRRLLQTELTDLERQFIRRRLAEEETAIARLMAGARDNGRISFAAGC